MTKKGAENVAIIKPRGGRRLAKKGAGELPALWPVIPLLAIAVLFSAFLLGTGMREAQEAAQSVPQEGGGLQVMTWTPGILDGLYGPSNPPDGSFSEESPAPTPSPDIWTEDDLEILAQLIWAEARGVRTTKEKAAVVWCVLNRLDSGRYGDSIREVVTAPYQFAWTEDRPVYPDLVGLALDVLQRWSDEKAGEENVGRVFPAEYLFFDGDEWAIANHFRVHYEVIPGDEWDWSLPDPYEEG